MELFIFAHFHAREGQEVGVATALRDTIAASREEAGCLAIEAYRSTRDPALFYIHSRWVDEAAFELHVSLPHTVRFLERVKPLLGQGRSVRRTSDAIRVQSGDGPMISQPWRWRMSANSCSFIDANLRCVRCCSSNNPPALAGV